ncbi:MAG: hypothetical protein RLZZ210_837 [Pseudomonadota bacterium]|jgi:valyl-tRNA synthetase
MQNYNPQDIEQNWQQKWEEQKIAKPSFDKPENFSIQLPPPNVTGTLHMGHAFNQTIMDTLARHARMSNKNTLWVPGTDHAGIATQIVVERQLEQKGIKRKEMTRTDFINKVWEWKDKSGGEIIGQIKRLGASISWEHEYFTMDEKMSNTVVEVFVKLYEDRLIYQGYRLVNWDPKLQTSVSDLEVVSQEEQGFLWHISYPLVDEDNIKNITHLTVATTRPETLFGDVAVMVNPNDERYQHLIGKKVKLPLTERTIEIIADDYVDMDFGTGVVKVTPAHDFNDYAVAQRHNLQHISIFNLDATCNNNVPAQFIGLNRFDARKQALGILKEQNLLVKEQPHTLMVPRCERTGEVIEPMLTKQWFVDLTKEKQENGKEGGLNAITKPALNAVVNKEIEFIPSQWQQTYEHWLNNIQDWCISRQLWWGHQIPAWYSKDKQQVFVAKNAEEAKKQAEKLGYTGELTQDEDVLDTWFSAGLVPFSSLGWNANDDEANKNNQLLNNFLPSSVLVTGYDIIFFWVARMVMFTKYFTDKVPFKTVYMHGLVRDADGKKMSKSEGNTLDPIDLIDGIDLDSLLKKRTTGLRRPETAPQVIEKTKQAFPEGIPAFGTDALRFTFASLASLGRSINFDAKRCAGYRNFCNKLWNATRFVLMNVEDKDYGQNLTQDEISKHLSFADIWMLNKLQQAQNEMKQHFATYRLDLGANTLYQLVWDEYCDWYLELAKVQMQKSSPEQAIATRYVLVYILEQILRLVHPIMPFITEELWQQITPFTKLFNSNTGVSIALQNYPTNVELLNNSSINKSLLQSYTASMELMQSIIHGCRNLRSEMGVAPSEKIALDIEDKQNSQDFLNKLLPYIQTLAKISEVNIHNEFAPSALPIVTLSSIALRFNIPIDIEAEKIRLGKEISKLEQEIAKCNAKLTNPAFVDKAPKAVVEQEQARLNAFTKTFEQIQQQLNQLEQQANMV